MTASTVPPSLSRLGGIGLFCFGNVCPYERVR